MSDQDKITLIQQISDYHKINKGLKLRGNLPMFAVFLILAILILNSFISG